MRDGILTLGWQHAISYIPCMSDGLLAYMLECVNVPSCIAAIINNVRDHAPTAKPTPRTI